MTRALGLLFVSLATLTFADTPAPLPTPAAEAAATPTPPPKPDVAPPAPVPVAKAAAAPAPPPEPRRFVPEAFASAVTEPPVIADESKASAEMLQWRDMLAAKKEHEIPRSSDIGGNAAIGIRLGGRSQIADLEGVSDEVRHSLEQWNGEGCLVLSVVPNSPAERAGLQPGDVIVQFAGIWIDSPSLMVHVASRSVVGHEQEAWVLRLGEIERAWVTPVDRMELGKN